MSRPRLLDLCCGAGGCSVGYHRAGYDVTGVDKEPHEDYPFELIVADALDVLADRRFLDRFELVHTSPPCPRYSTATPADRRDSHGDHGDSRQHKRPDGTSRGAKARNAAHAREVMGIDWMRDWDDLADAIPPAYTEHIGNQILGQGAALRTPLS